MNTLQSWLFSVAQQYADWRGINLVTLGRYAADDGKLFPRLIAGGDIGTARFIAVMRWLADHWPGGLPWPAGVPRQWESRETAIAEGNCGALPAAVSSADEVAE